jgi:DNA-binding PadR family transcriptional regulator
MRMTKNDILQGTLVLLILKTLAAQKHMHGYAITARIHAVSDQRLRPPAAERRNSSATTPHR